MSIQIKRAVILLGVSGLLHGCGGGGPDSWMEGITKDLIPPAPGEVARNAFNVYDADQRRRSVNLLSNATWGGEEPYLRTYRLLVDDPDPTVRAASLRALSRHGTAEDVPKILPYLKDTTDYVRWEATMALQRLHHKNAIDPLIAVVRDDEQADVRSAAAYALGQYPESRVFQSLVGALNDDDFSVADQAARSLELLTGQKFGQDGAKWLQWAENRDNLFTSKGEYTYKQYIRPPGFLDHMQFWKSHPEAVAMAPRGDAPAIAKLPLTPAPAAPGTSPLPEPARSPSLSARESDVPAPMVAKPGAAPAAPTSPTPAATPAATTVVKPPSAAQPAPAISPATTPKPAQTTSVKPPAPAVTPAPASSPVTMPATPTTPATPAPATTAAPQPAKPAVPAAATTSTTPPPAPSKPATAPATPAAKPAAPAGASAPSTTPPAAPGAKPPAKVHPLGATDGRDTPMEEEDD